MLTHFNKNVPRRQLELLIFIFFAMASTSTLAQDVYSPGDAATGLGPSGGSIAPCDTSTSGLAETVCTRSYSTSDGVMFAFVATAKEGEASAKTAVALFYQFEVDLAESGAATVLNGSLIEFEAAWVGDLVGIGPKGTAGYEIEALVSDLTTNTVIANETLKNKEVKGSIKVLSVGGAPVPTPWPDYDIDSSGNPSLVLPVSLTRGHSYRVALRLKVSATGALQSDGHASFDPDSGFDDDKYVEWVGLNLTIGSDPIEELTKQIDELKEQLAKHDEEIKVLLNGMEDAQVEIIRLLLTPHGKRSSDYCEKGDCSFPAKQ